MYLTAEDDNLAPEVSEVQPSKRINKRQTQLESSVADIGDVESFSLSKLFDKTLLAELISEDLRIGPITSRNREEGSGRI